MKFIITTCLLAVFANSSLVSADDPVGGQVRGTCNHAHLNSGGPAEEGGCHSECSTVSCPLPPPIGGIWTNAVVGACEGDTGTCDPNGPAVQLCVQTYHCDSSNAGCDPGEQKCTFTAVGPPINTLTPDCQ